MSAKAVKTLVQAFISCRLDRLLYLTVLRHHRRSDEPAAVCPEWGCTSVVGRSTVRPYHWLPVRRRVDFKIATLGYLSLSGMAPAYLAADCQLVSDEGRRQLRSARSRTCVVRRIYSNYGDRCFAAAGPKLWNSLPAELWQADISFHRFNRILKTFLFGCWDVRSPHIVTC